jgi:hypothetical protein
VALLVHKPTGAVKFETVQVIQNRVNGYGATIVCDAEYANP